MCVFIVGSHWYSGRYCFDFPRRPGQASSLLDSNLHLKRREKWWEEGQCRENSVYILVCVLEREQERLREGKDGMMVSWGKFAEKYEDTLESREQINKGCFL